MNPKPILMDATGEQAFQGKACSDLLPGFPKNTHPRVDLKKEWVGGLAVVTISPLITSTILGLLPAKAGVEFDREYRG